MTATTQCKSGVYPPPISPKDSASQLKKPSRRAYSDFFKNNFLEIADDPTILIFGDEARPAPLITFIIPTCFRASTLKDAVDCIINQRGDSDYEIVVCDDNPVRHDETETLMDAYRSIPNLRYYKNSRNLGMAGNWNRLCQLAKGEWMVMLHDDDMLSPAFLKIMSEVIRSSDRQRLIFPTYTMDYDTFAKTDEITEVTLEKVRKWHFVSRNYIGAPVGMCVKRETAIHLGGFDATYYPPIDQAFYIKCLLSGVEIIRILSEPIAYYRILVNVSLSDETINGCTFQHVNIRNEFYRHFPAITRLILKPYRKICYKLYAEMNNSHVERRTRRWPLSKFETFLHLIYGNIFSRILMRNKHPEKIHIPR